MYFVYLGEGKGVEGMARTLLLGLLLAGALVEEGDLVAEEGGALSARSKPARATRKMGLLKPYLNSQNQHHRRAKKHCRTQALHGFNKFAEKAMIGLWILQRCA